MNSSNRILQQVIKHREQARAVRDGSASSTRNTSLSRPHSALSSYEIGAPLRLSEPSKQLHGRLQGGPTNSLVSTASRPSSPAEVGADRLQITGNESRKKVASVCDGAEDAAEIAAVERPHSAASSAAGSRRPPSPYRRALPQAPDDIQEMKRWAAQLQSRIMTLELQLQQANGQKRMLTNQLRKFKSQRSQAVDSGTTSDHDASAAEEDCISGQEGDDTDRSPPGVAVDAEDGAVSEQAALLELSERESQVSGVRSGTNVTSFHGNNTSAEVLDPNTELVRKTLGEDCAHRFAFAVDVRSEEDIRDLLLLACSKLDRRVVTQARHQADLLSDSEAKMRQRAVLLMSREAKQPSHVLKQLLDSLKHESAVLAECSKQRMTTAVQLFSVLHQQLQLMWDDVRRIVSDVGGVKAMLLGRSRDVVISHASSGNTEAFTRAAVEPLSLSAVGEYLDSCLSAALRMCKRGSAVSESTIRLQSELQETIVKMQALHASRSKRAESLLRHDSRAAATEASSHQGDTSLSSAAETMRHLSSSFDALLKQCLCVQSHTVRDSMTEEELLLVYRHEVADARRRCCRPHAEVDVQTDDAAADGTRESVVIHVPTTADATSRPSSTASQGARGKGKRPHSGSSAPNQAPPQPLAVGIPTVVKNLVACINAIHTVFTETTFGSIVANSTYRSLQEQQRIINERHAHATALSAALGGTSLSKVVVVDRKGRSTGAMASSPYPLLHTDVAAAAQIDQAVSCLPNTYGEILLRHDRSQELAVFPTTLSQQDEDDIAQCIGVVQRLVEVGVLWHEALAGLRVHHASNFLFLVRYSRPMRAAYFFHSTALEQSASAELVDSGAAFAGTLRDAIWPSDCRKGKHLLQDKQQATSILYKLRLLADAAHSRAKFNWRGLLVLHKHMRVKQLIVTAITHRRRDDCARGKVSGVDPSDDGADALRSVVTAFYNDFAIKFDAERRLLRSSLRLTVDAIWTELVTLLRESAQLCLRSGVNLDALEALGPSYASVLTQATKHMSEIVAAKKSSDGGLDSWRRVRAPSQSHEMGAGLSAFSTQNLQRSPTAPPSPSPPAEGLQEDICDAAVESHLANTSSWLGMRISNNAADDGISAGGLYASKESKLKAAVRHQQVPTSRSSAQRRTTAATSPPRFAAAAASSSESSARLPSAPSPQTVADGKRGRGVYSVASVVCPENPWVE